MKPKIFLDMDGVLVDLLAGIEKFYGYPVERSHEGIPKLLQEMYMEREEFWTSLTSDFWANLPKMKDADMILALVEPYKPVILSAHPGVGIAQCIEGKTRWLTENLPEYMQDDRYIFSGRVKGHLAHPNAILIDDHENTISAWNANGGDGILVPRQGNSLEGCDTITTLQGQLMTLLGDAY